MYPPLTGVHTPSQVEGGLLMALAEEESGGVDGANLMSAQSVSMGRRYGLSWWTSIVGLWYSGRGEAIGVSMFGAPYKGMDGYAAWELEEDGRG